MHSPEWNNKHYAFFANKECEYFPCHSHADPNRFNCLFCYCPLYVLGDHCGGNFHYHAAGLKDCTDCLYPHDPKNYGDIIKRYPEILALLPPHQKSD